MERARRELIDREINQSSGAFLENLKRLTDDEERWASDVCSFLAETLGPHQAAAFRDHGTITEKDKDQHLGLQWNGQYIVFRIRMERRLSRLKSIIDRYDMPEQE